MDREWRAVKNHDVSLATNQRRRKKSLLSSTQNGSGARGVGSNQAVEKERGRSQKKRLLWFGISEKKSLEK